MKFMFAKNNIDVQRKFCENDNLNQHQYLNLVSSLKCFIIFVTWYLIIFFLNRDLIIGNDIDSKYILSQLQLNVNWIFIFIYLINHLKILYIFFI